MPTGYQIKEQDKPYFVTLQIVNWIDLFTRENYHKIITDNLEYCIHKKGLVVFGWLLMSNHLHMIIKSNSNNLSGTLRDFKSYSSKRILEEIQNCTESRAWMIKLFSNSARKNKRNSEFQVWTQENHAKILYSNNFIEQKLEYIHLNPVRNGIVSKPEDYRYSSAIDYSGGRGFIPLEMISVRWKTY